MDVYKKFLAPRAEAKRVVTVGRVAVVVFSIIAVLVAPQLGNPKISHSIFTIIQESQGFISPGILAVFVFGLLVRRGPPMCGVVGLVTNIIAYGALKLAVPQLQFLNRMAVCFGLCLVMMALITALKPLAQPVEFRQNTTIALESSHSAKVAGVVVVLVTLALYVIFSPLVLAR
jgi:SSS family solute:Na+ symporter